MTVQGEVAENIEAAAVIVRTEMSRQLTQAAAEEVREAAKAAIDKHYEHVVEKGAFEDVVVEETPPETESTEESPEDVLDEGGDAETDA